MYLTSSRPDIMFVVYACARYQVNPKVSHLHAVKMIFRYLKGQPKLGLWYPKNSHFDLVAYTDSDYAGASLDRKSTTKGCQFLRCRLISWQCKKQTVVANSIIEAEYVAASSCCGQLYLILLGKANKSVRLMMEKLFGMELELILVTQKSDGFEQIVDFLNAHPIKYALTINPTIYTSCIEQFWSTVKAKTINGEVQLHALVDGKKIIITESSVRRDLKLEDEEGIDCLPNSTIFEQLTLMGYEKISQKLTFYKPFFSPQWKFLIHTILQCLSPKTTAWNEFSSTMASAIICLATNQKFNFSKYIFESMVRNLDNLSRKFLMYPRFVQVFLNQQLDGLPTHKRIYIAPSHTKKIFGNMRRVGKGFSGRVTPLFPTMVVQNQAELGEDKAVHKELDDSLVRAATTASSLEAEQDSGNITKTRSKATPNESSSPGTTSGGGPRRCLAELSRGWNTLGLTFQKTDLVENLFQREQEKSLEEEEYLRSKKRKGRLKDKDTTELQSLMEVIPDEEEVAIDVVPLAIKSPSIVGWKIHKEGKQKLLSNNES
ncbi:hypothetical protein Tco_0014999 [Tanacetum coccineum]